MQYIITQQCKGIIIFSYVWSMIAISSLCCIRDQHRDQYTLVFIPDESICPLLAKAQY